MSDLASAQSSGEPSSASQSPLAMLANISVLMPNCARMLSDAVRMEQLEKRLEVLCIAEILERARK